MEGELPPVPASAPKHDENSKFAMFESVIAKYFEIIKGILPKISSLYLQNEEFEQNIYSLESKVGKMGSEIENLHYQMRTNHLMIESKLNTIVNNYTSVSLENANLKKQTQQLSREVKAVKQWKSTIPSKNLLKRKGSPDYPEQESQMDFNQGRMRKSATRRIKFEDQVDTKSHVNGFSSRPSLDEECEHSHLEVQCQSVESENEQKTESSIQFTQTNIPCLMKSEKLMKRKGTLKKETKFSERKNLNSKSDKIIIDKSISDESDIDRLKDVLKDIAHFHEKNQAIKQNYQQLMSEYCRVNNEQFSRINQELKELKDMNKKNLELDQCNVHIEKIKISTDHKIKDLAHTLEMKIDQKVSHQEFNSALIDINHRFGSVHDERKKVANREETRKAIMFLEDKLNQLYADLDVINGPKLHLVELDMPSKRGRSSLLTRNPQNRDLAHKTVHQDSYFTPKEQIATQRQGYSHHSRFRSQNQRFNEQLVDNRLRSAQRVNQDAKTIRNSKTPVFSQKLKLLKEKAINIIGPKDQAKSRTKLKKQRLIFQYDA